MAMSLQHEAEEEMYEEDIAMAMDMSLQQEEEE
jgi:hypothetical protein